ncbi:MAG: hypothetical protein SCARUB_04528 [Candidatus Scalindua rubra]|uniref:Uncharacterized protein n=1 Tax=Candidatus Scalindua rubra TaxID=1872076 RepID=A0A1E3X489_9BACT|nr:MAG: hypothetical protein SCARUB_04528 [Candidatus Scalindua rubra]
MLGVARQMLRENSMSYILKDIPRELFQQFRAKLVAENKTVRDVFLDYIEDYVGV